MDLCIIPLCLSFTLPLTLTFSMLHWGNEGTREERSGQQTGEHRGNQNVQGAFSAATLSKRKKQILQHTETAANWGSLIRPTSSHPSPLQYLGYHFIICIFAILFSSWSTWWDSSCFVLIWEIREMGVTMKHNWEDISFPSPYNS